MAKDEKETTGYQDGAALKGTSVDLNSANFRNKDVMSWSDRKASLETSVVAPLNGLSRLGQIGKLPRYSKNKAKK